MSPDEENELDALLERGLSSAFGPPAAADATRSSSGTCAVQGAPRAARELPAVPEAIGPYRITGRIGQGGMGIVYGAEDPDLGRRLAIKVMHSGLETDVEMLSRFEEEARICSRLEHPGVVAVHTLERLPDGRPFFTMRLVDGETLAARLARASGEVRNRAQLLDTFLRICQTVAYAHAHGVQHRDLKPANVMIGAFGEVQVMDWGFASSATAAGDSGHDQVDSSSGRVLGTPAYMAPEQARGEEDHIDARCDVFSLGAILCEILTGEPPYLGESKHETLLMASKAWLEEAWGRLEECAADPALVDLARRCLAPDPAHRPRDGGELAEQIGDHLASLEQRTRDLQIEAAQERARASAERRSRRLVLALALVVLVALTIGAGTWIWMQDRAATRQRETEIRVGAALQEAGTLRGEARRATSARVDRWGDAVAAAERALGLARSGDARSDTLERARRFLDSARAERQAVIRDQQTAEWLLHIRGHLGDMRSPRLIGKQYAEAFESCDIHVLQDEPAKVARDIRDSSIADQLLVALDDWCHVLERLPESERGLSRRLLHIATTADSHAWRNAVRSAWAATNRAHLLELAKAAGSEARSAADMDLLARSLLSLQEAQAAIRVYRRAHEVHPGDFWINHNLGNLLRGRPGGSASEVSRLFGMAVAARPDSVHALCDLAHALILEGAFERALKYLQRVEAREPGNPYVHVYRGYVAFRREDFAAAARELRKAVTIDPDIFEAWRFLGRSLLRLGKLEDASMAAATAAKLGPRDPDPLTVLGMAAMGLRQYDQAIGYWKRVTDMQPANPDAWYNLGVARQEAGFHKEAEQAYVKARGLDPQRPEILCNLGLLELVRGRFAEGLALLEEGDRLGRARGSAWQHPSGDWVQEARTLIEAERRLGLVAKGEHVPGSVDERCWLGRAAELTGRHQLAVQLFSPVLDTEPGLLVLGQPTNGLLGARACLAAGIGLEAQTPPLPVEERRKLRERARDWLQRTATTLLEDERQGRLQPAARRAILERWTRDRVLRMAWEKDRLPEPEAMAWRRMRAAWLAPRPPEKR